MTGGSGHRPYQDATGPQELPELSLPEPPAGMGTATLAGALGERYQLLARLGAGAFGEVYRAHDRVLGREVAVKRVRLEAFAEPAALEDAKQRFLREAQVAARLRHPNIVTTHDIVSSPGMSFIVMELVLGRTLQAILDERRRLPLDETAAILRQVAGALDHAHASGVVHRDVKPANVMVEPSGQVKVMDFGIAKLESGADLTASGTIMGTPNYMSPEQARGERANARSDLFSLGCVLYECLTGVRPFQADSVGLILVKILTEDPPPIDFAATGLPPGMEAVLHRATAKDPNARFGSGAEMMEAAVAAAAGRPQAGARTVVAKPRAAVRPRLCRRPLLVGAIALFAVSAVALVTTDYVLRSRRTALSAHVVEESRGLVDHVLGRPSRLRVTLPEATRLRLILETPLSSETAKAGVPVVALVSDPLRIEGVLAIPTGGRLHGEVVQAASADEADGRGELVLAFDSLDLDAQRVRLHTRPLTLRAPPPPKKGRPKRKDNPLLDGLAQVGTAVGDLLERVKADTDASVQGGSAATVTVANGQGRDVALPERAALTVTLSEPVTVVRPKP